MRGLFCCNLFDPSPSINLSYGRASFTEFLVAEDEDADREPKPVKEAIDRKEVMRVEHILAQLQRRVKHR